MLEEWKSQLLNNQMVLCLSLVQQVQVNQQLLYSVLSQLDTNEINVSTIEDPIEAQISRD